MKKAVELVNLSKSFRNDIILNNITYSFETGKIHGIIGFNGSGKTVLFKCICGFIKPSAGQIWVNGDQIGKDVDFPQSLGMLIENPGFLPYLSGYDNLKCLAEIKNIIGKKEIMEAMLRVGLEPVSHKKVGRYSLGMRERLGIAQAIMENPDILILDEPFNGLDKRGVSEICELLKELRACGKTVLLAAHNMPQMEQFCDTICELDAGILSRIK